MLQTRISMYNDVETLPLLVEAQTLGGGVCLPENIAGISLDHNMLCLDNKACSWFIKKNIK